MITYVADTDSSSPLLVRSRRKQRVVAALIGCLGVAAICAGAPLTLLGDGTGRFLLGFGLAASSWTPLILLLGNAPERFFFDNDAGQLRVTDTLGTEGGLPYAEILGFVVLPPPNPENNQWTTSLLRVNGTTWALFMSRAQADCERTQRWLEDRVSLGSACTAPIATDTPPLHEEQRPTSTLLRWQQRPRTAQFPSFFFIIFGILLCFSGAAEGPVAGLIALSAALVAGAGVAMAYRQGSGWEEMKIGPVVTAGRVGSSARFTMPLAEIDTVGFFLKPGQEEPWLTVLDDKDAEHLRRLETDEWGASDLFAAARIALSQRRLLCSGWTVPEKLVLERTIRAALDRHADGTP